MTRSGQTNSIASPPAGIAAVLRCPRCWLALQLSVVIVAAGLLGLGHVRYDADSKSYIETSQAPLHEALLSIRTLGYPLLIRGVAAVTPDQHHGREIDQYRLLPWVHLAMLAAAVFFFDFALRRFGFSPWTSLVISSAIVYAALPLRTPVDSLLADFAAMTLAVTTVACLLWIVADRKKRPFPGWRYGQPGGHVPGAALVPVPGSFDAVPGHWFCLPVEQGQEAPLVWKALLVGLLAAATLPLLAYCSWRWKMVGDFGLVSFAGYNLSGLAVELLDVPMVEGELSEQFRPFARQLMAERQRQDLTPAFGPGLRVSLRQYENNFSIDIYRVALPVARRFYGSDPLACNRQLSRFSREVIGLRKGRYLLWAAATVFRAAEKIVRFGWILWVLVPAAALSLAAGLWKGPARRGTSDVAAGGFPHAVGLLAALAATYFLAYMGVICLSGTYADSRLVVPAGVFLPSLLAMVIVGQGEKIGLLRRA